MATLEIRIAIKEMLTSKDTEVNILGWNLFVNEYEKTIMKRIRLHHYPQLTKPSEAIDFLTKSIAQTKRRMKK